MNVNVLRSESTGSIHIKSADPAEPPAIRFNFLSAAHDRAGMLAAIRKGRELMATSPLKEVTGEEIAPGAQLQSDDELLDWVRKNAETTYHPVGTCKMGSDPWRWSIASCGCTASTACASPTPRSCRR